MSQSGDWSPEAALWIVTENCNLDCGYCYVRDRTDAVDTDHRHRIAERLSGYEIESINFTGGDPLTAWDDLRELLPYFEDVEISIDTNGCFLTESVAAELADYPEVHVQMTLNGPTAEIHDASRGAGSFEGLVEATEVLQAYDIPYSFGTTLLPSNVEYVRDICECAVELGAHAHGFNGYMPVVNMVDQYDHLLEPEDFRTAIREIRECHDEFADEIDVHAGTTLPFAFLFDEPRREAFEMGGDCLSVCAMGRTVYLTPHGDLIPCLYIRDRMGNILEDDLREVMTGDKASRYRTIAQDGERSGPCSSCRYSDACGGCPAMSMSVYGDPAAGDPRCWIGEGSD